VNARGLCLCLIAGRFSKAPGRITAACGAIGSSRKLTFDYGGQGASHPFRGAVGRPKARQRLAGLDEGLPFLHPVLAGMSPGSMADTSTASRLSRRGAIFFMGGRDGKDTADP